MVDLHVRQDAVLLKDPVDLFLFAPDHVPIIVPSLLPFTIYASIIDCIFKGGFKFNIIALL